jgi:hypothetical protein
MSPTRAKQAVWYQNVAFGSLETHNESGQTKIFAQLHHQWILIVVKAGFGQHSFLSSHKPGKIERIVAQNTE